MEFKQLRFFCNAEDTVITHRKFRLPWYGISVFFNHCCMPKMITMHHNNEIIAAFPDCFDNLTETSRPYH